MSMDAEAVRTVIAPRTEGSHCEIIFDKTEIPEGGLEKFFIVPRKVVVRYGPFMYQSVLAYRTERLQGLQLALRKAGAKICMVRTQNINEVTVWHMNVLMFNCDIRDLQYGTGELDLVCDIAVQCFEQSCQQGTEVMKKRYKMDEFGNQQSYNPFAKKHIITTYALENDQPPEDEDQQSQQNLESYAPTTFEDKEGEAISENQNEE